MQGKVKILDAPLAEVEVVGLLVESQINVGYFGLFGIGGCVYLFIFSNP